jgi:hypothetical protein
MVSRSVVPTLRKKREGWGTRLPTRDRIFSSFLLEIICKLANGQARKLFNHPLMIQSVETCSRQRRPLLFWTVNEEPSTCQTLTNLEFIIGDG